ncbi:MAG: polyprenyl synthetase family protein, partial [Rubrivivax sp.]|nr:polyprenyl synthetase family protein [Rubrivivax sp.]
MTPSLFQSWMHQVQTEVEAALGEWVPADAPAGLGVAMR